MRTSILVLVASALLLSACSTVRFNERKRLGEAAMQFDPNPLAAEMIGKIMTSREASVGGFHGSAVGGCGCN